MTKKTVIYIILALVLAVGSYLLVELLTNNTEHEGDVEIVHELGTTFVKSNPEKVVVFDFGILETLDVLGIQAIGVPKANLPESLSKYSAANITDVGTLFEPNFEVIFDLKPDLIIISARQSDLYQELAALAPTIYLPLDNINFMESFKYNLEVLSQIFTNENGFTSYIDAIESDVSSLATIAQGSGLNALVIMVNSNNISALGLGSRFDVIHSVFQVNPADPNITVSTHGQNVNFEYIAQINPDILFVVDRGVITEGTGTAEALLNNVLVNQTNAAQQNKIIYLDPVSWYISTGGVDSMQVMMSDILKAFE